MYWPEFGANGKADITVREVMRHRAGLSHLHGVGKAELLDHRLMEQRIAAAPVNRLQYGKSAYHALTYGWLMSGLGRAVTGKGMRELVREELAEPLNADGLHLGRPPADAPTRAAQILAPQGTRANPVFNLVAPKFAALQYSGMFGALYFPGMKSFVQGDIPFLDAEVPSVNGVATARGLAKMYGAIANGGQIDGGQFLSQETAAGLTGRRDLWPDRNIFVPLAFHLGYHTVPFGVMPGFGHVGLGGSLGWADPATGLAVGFVHNRLLTPMLLDMTAFVGLGALIRQEAAACPQARLPRGARLRDAVRRAEARRGVGQPESSNRKPTFSVTWKCPMAPFSRLPRTDCTSNQSSPRIVSAARDIALRIAASILSGELPTTSMTR